jgi:hypothetical protein
MDQTQAMDRGPAPDNTVSEVAGLVAVAGAVFYLAEKGKNEKVNDYWDALLYVATSLSVGYSNVFPATPVGKILGAVIQTVGPALSSRAMEPAGGPTAPADPALLGKLDDILGELRRLNSAG